MDGKLTKTGWHTEQLPRHGKIILVIYFDEEVRGQIELEKEEIDQWIKLIGSFNDEQQ